MAHHRYVITFYDRDGKYRVYWFNVVFPEGLDVAYWKRENESCFTTLERVLTPRTGWIVERIVAEVLAGRFPSISLEPQRPDEFQVSPNDLLTLCGIFKMGMFVESSGDDVRRAFFEEVC